MFKKILVLSLLFVPFVYAADPVAVATAVVPSSSMPAVPFDLKVFIQQILTNGGLALIAFLVTRIPVIGGYLRKIVDFLSANIKH